VSYRVLTPLTLIPPIRTHSYRDYRPIYYLNSYGYSISDDIYNLNDAIYSITASIYSLNGSICSPNGAPFSLRYQTNGSAYAQQKLGDRWLIEARNLALNSEALADSHDLEVVEEVLLLYVLHS
jgi:hypothetical protein